MNTANRMHRLNVVVEGFLNPLAAQVFEKALREFSLGTVLTISKTDAYTPKLPAEEQVWHRYDLSQPIHWNTIRPFDEALIEAMRAYETICMEMQSRWEERGRIITYQERKRVYYRHLRYWNHILEEKKIDILLLHNVPHVEATWVLYGLCKLKGIPTLCFRHEGPLRDNLILLEDWEQPAAEIRDLFEKLRSEHRERDGTVQLSPPFEQYIAAQIAKGKTPWYMTSHFVRERSRAWHHLAFDMLRRTPGKFVYLVGRTAMRLLQPWRWPEFCRAFHEHARARAMFRFYASHALLSPDTSKAYVYVPLHFQPECSTCPLAGAFVDQLLIVELLASVLPSDVLLYVKEHPDQKGPCREKAFYEKLLRIPSVRLISRNVSSFLLSEHCRAIATATGEAGIEAAIRGKPVFLFGHRYYQYLSGVFPIRSAEDCRNAAAAIFQRGVKPSLDDVRMFLKAFEQMHIQGYLASVNQEPSDWEHVENVAQALALRMRAKLEEKGM